VQVQRSIEAWDGQFVLLPGRPGLFSQRMAQLLKSISEALLA
jgi:hypothetical protein